jgi:hypothetical protein
MITSDVTHVTFRGEVWEKTYTGVENIILDVDDSVITISTDGERFLISLQVIKRELKGNT